jgi:Double zinc ribbon
MPHHRGSPTSGLGFGSFFDSTAWHLFQNLSIMLALTFWLASVWWVLRDARRRIDDPWIVGMATILAFVPFIGALLYLLVRPLEPVADRRARELELRALRRRLTAGSYCPACGADADPSFRFCPACAVEIRPACSGCETPLDPIWKACPYCGTSAEPEPAERPEAAPPLVEVLTPKVSQSVSH